MSTTGFCGSIGGAPVSSTKKLLLFEKNIYIRCFETQSAEESLNLNTSVVADTTGKDGTLNRSKICPKVPVTGTVTLILFWGTETTGVFQFDRYLSKTQLIDRVIVLEQFF